MRIATFDGEPLARLGQQRLQQEGIPCVVKSLGVGYGAWGGSAFVPHALYVLAQDRRRAIGVIRGTDSPEYLLDSDAVVEDRRDRVVGRLLVAAAVAILGMAILAAIYTTLR
ncbi:MAG: hypothetical protein HW388_125 [Dehalococcoidia bacterium]|nr:hypothetical protein [Dehalococcoidia bacterium]